jgi:hypothetical protein
MLRWPTLIEARRQRCRQARLDRFQTVIDLGRRGHRQYAIAKQVGISAGTVSRWLHARAFPERQIRSDRRRECDSLSRGPRGSAVPQLDRFAQRKAGTSGAERLHNRERLPATRHRTVVELPRADHWRFDLSHLRMRKGGLTAGPQAGTRRARGLLLARFAPVTPEVRFIEAMVDDADGRRMLRTGRRGRAPRGAHCHGASRGGRSAAAPGPAARA